MSYINDPNNETEAKSMFTAGMLVAECSRADEDGIPYVLRPNNSTLESLEHLLPEPLSVRQTVQLDDQDSFIRYVRAFKQQSTVIFFDENKDAYTAIIDYHRAPGEMTLADKKEKGKEPDLGDMPDPVNPQWCRHRAVFTLQHTDEWNRWTACSGSRQSQANFANFIDANIQDIASKDRAAMQTVSLGLTIRQDVSFESAKPIEGTGGLIRLAYTETTEGHTMAGDIKIPAAFSLEIAPYKGGLKQTAPCRFRYQLVNKTATLWFEIAQPEKVLDGARQKIQAAIMDATELPVLMGRVS